MNPKHYVYTVKTVAQATDRTEAAIRQAVRRGYLKMDNIVSVALFIARFVTRRDASAYE